MSLKWSNIQSGFRENNAHLDEEKILNEQKGMESLDHKEMLFCDWILSGANLCQLESLSIEGRKSCLMSRLKVLKVKSLLMDNYWDFWRPVYLTGPDRHTVHDPTLHFTISRPKNMSIDVFERCGSH